MLATAVSNNLAESRTNKFPFMAASVGGLFQFVRLWHFADKTTAPGFVAYWTNNGQRWISARVGYDAIGRVEMWRGGFR